MRIVTSGWIKYRPATFLVAAIVWGVGLPRPATADLTSRSVVLEFQHLNRLDEAIEGHFEGWAIVDHVPVSTGIFNVNAAGLPVDIGTGALIEQFEAPVEIQDATDFSVTIEPSGDRDPSPSGIRILTGTVRRGIAELHVNLPGFEAFDSPVVAQYILATPSDDAVAPDNSDQGLWFMRTPGPTAGLTTLPPLGPTWTYEGWIMDVSAAPPVAHSLGTFREANAQDSDGAGCMGGGPGYPGQEFTAYQCGPVLDLDQGNFRVVITIEPVPDNAPEPFQLEPFSGLIPVNALGHANPIWSQPADTFPSGSAYLQEEPTAVENVTWGELKAKH